MTTLSRPTAVGDQLDATGNPLRPGDSVIIAAGYQGTPYYNFGIVTANNTGSKADKVRVAISFSSTRNRDGRVWISREDGTKTVFPGQCVLLSDEEATVRFTTLNSTCVERELP
jgi:hypothetical protein